MMYPGSKTDWLSGFPMLQNIKDETWLETLKKIDLLDVPAGITVFRPGDECRNLLFLIRGRVRVFMTGDNGREIVLSHLNGGDLCVFTLTTLLQTAAYSVEAITEEPTRAACLPASDFREAFARSRGFQDYILENLSMRMHDTLFLLQQVAFDRLETRLANFLLRNAREREEIEITHQQIASELGTTREMVSRILKSMERRGCISLRRRHIRLTDTHGLQAIHSA